ncbi:transmembrane 9 superfamily member 2 [Trichonephila clavipes]|nr:transmembrane 9 superfamily member 2 [Trichonephila clavipes]
MEKICFDFCTADDYESPVENLGQVVFGERIRPSPYNISFLKDISCATVCEKTYHMDRKDDVEKLDNLKKACLRIISIIGLLIICLLLGAI